MNFCVVTREMVLVQAERGGDLAQHERPHRHFAVLEEVALAVDDGLRDSQDRVEALLHILMSQRASCSCEEMPAPLRAAAASSAYSRLMRKRGIASGLRLARQTLRTLRTMTSGIT